MDSSTLTIFIVLIVLFLIFFQEEKTKKEFIRQIRKKIQQRKKGDFSIMNEIIKNYLGKECIITTLSSTIAGTIESIEDNWISVQGKGGSEIINIDYISRIQEYPRKKNGKKKMIVG